MYGMVLLSDICVKYSDSLSYSLAMSYSPSFALLLSLFTMPSSVSSVMIVTSGAANSGLVESLREVERKVVSSWWYALTCALFCGRMW